MRNRNYRQRLTIMAMCSILLCHAPIVHATNQNNIEQDTEKSTIVQNGTDTEIDNSMFNEFTDEANETDTTEDTAVGNNRELTNPRTEHLTFIPEIVDYTCNSDILFKFNNGVGDEALKEITKVIIFPYENASEDKKKESIATFDYEDECFSYDTKKGELILRNDALKESALIPGESYCVEIHGNRRDGIPLELENSKEWIINYIASQEIILDEEENNPVQKETEQINPLFKITDIDEHSNEQHVLDLENANTSLSAVEMQNLIEINKEKDVIIHTNDGVTFTFFKSSMKMVDGKEHYDFGVELISDCKQADVDIPDREFVFRIKYHNTGELPGTAQVSIPVGSQWAGQEVFYAAMDDRGILYMSTEIVDASGIYTIPDLWFTL